MGEEDILRHVVVSVAAYAESGHEPRHLESTLECVSSWLGIAAIETVELTVYTNNEAAIAPIVGRLKASPPRWNVVTSLRAHRRSYMLTHAHLADWAAIAARLSRASAFIHLEDDLCPSPASLVSWAKDESLLDASGAAAAGFQRGFYRFEVTRPASEMSWQRVVGLHTATASNTKYTAAFINARAAAWRAKYNITLGERFVLDERMHRRFQSPVCTDWPCGLQPQEEGDMEAATSMPLGEQATLHLGGKRLAKSGRRHRKSSTTARKRSHVSTERLNGSTGWCSNYPTLVAKHAGVHRAFIALSNPYSAITAAPRSLVEAFLLRSRGWNMSVSDPTTNGTASITRRGTTNSPSKFRTRHKAYAVREFGSSTFHYSHEFLPFESAGRWPSGQRDEQDRVSVGHRGGMRRVLVPLVSDMSRLPKYRWRLDTSAGVHHMSDRTVNGPRKGWEANSARFREAEVVQCGLGKRFKP